MLGEHVDQQADRQAGLGRVAEVLVQVEAVAVAPPHPVAAEVAALVQVAHDVLHGPLGDADAGGDVAQPDVGVPGDLHEHPGVVGEERPAGRPVVGCAHVRRLFAPILALNGRVKHLS
ncbi:hypothetical protein ACFQ0B_25545 [Nonomuraea thailandensis]